MAVDSSSAENQMTPSSIASIIGVREIITEVVRRIGLVVTMKQHTYVIEIAIDNSINMTVLECNVLPATSQDEILRMIEDDVEFLTKEEIVVYLRMTIWILNRVHSGIRIDGVTFIYNSALSMDAISLLNLCTDILHHCQS